jgi:Protein of unknown function (DUF3619)
MNSLKKTLRNAFAPAGQAEAAEARVALRITRRLSAGADQLPHDITERLRVARNLALDRARASRKLVATQAIAVQLQGSGALAMGGPPSWWLRLASVAPLAVLVGGLIFIQYRYVEQQIAATAEIDAALLTDDLPPQAYSDPGFSEFLRAPKSLQ